MYVIVPVTLRLGLGILAKILKGSSNVYRHIFDFPPQTPAEQLHIVSQEHSTLCLAFYVKPYRYRSKNQLPAKTGIVKLSTCLEGDKHEEVSGGGGNTWQWADCRSCIYAAHI